VILISDRIIMVYDNKHNLPFIK